MGFASVFVSCILIAVLRPPAVIGHLPDSVKPSKPLLAPHQIPTELVSSRRRGVTVQQNSEPRSLNL